MTDEKEYVTIHVEGSAGPHFGTGLFDVRGTETFFFLTDYNNKIEAINARKIITIRVLSPQEYQTLVYRYQSLADKNGGENS